MSFDLTIRSAALLLTTLLLLCLCAAREAAAAGGESPVEVPGQVMHPVARADQTPAEAEANSAGCRTCHVDMDTPTMHANAAVTIGCTDCHGGDASVRWEGPAWTAPDGGGHAPGERAPHADREAEDGGRHYPPGYFGVMTEAHVRPSLPQTWHWPSSANPFRTYTALTFENAEFIRFVNPGDYRVVRLACGACHLSIIQAAERSLMATGAMLWGGAAYNNGILPFKNYIAGESYTVACSVKNGVPMDCGFGCRIENGTRVCERDPQPVNVGEPAAVESLWWPDTSTPEGRARAAELTHQHGAIQRLVPLPAWETLPPADVFRVFERGGRNIVTQFPEIGIPNSLGQLQRLEEPGRPDIRQSNRGPGTGLRIAVPVINITKTRLNDPFTWFLGTNDNPGDFRNSGCTACHTIYANDRQWESSGPYARFGNSGETQTVDPTIPLREGGHPLQHAFTRSIPSSQCMICHMHQPNMFINTFLGYTMWDYESDAELMWPKEQVHYDELDHGLPADYAHEREECLAREAADLGPLDDEERARRCPPNIRELLDRNPEEAVIRGRWADPQFLRAVFTDVNPRTDDTTFADYHGHGWNFRAIYKRDRDGNLIDVDGNLIPHTDPQDWDRAVHMRSIHAELGMHCVDCHFAQDGHGNGYIQGEVANAVEIRCADCHGTVDNYPTLRTSGPAARPGGNDLSLIRNPDGSRRFEWRDGRLYQRSAVTAGLEWEVSLTRDTVDPSHPDFNAKAARAKTMGRLVDGEEPTLAWGPGIAPEDRAHPEDGMACYTCHLAWTTSCAGCHLPIQANWYAPRHHYEGNVTRNWASYNPQVARDEMFQLGIHGTSKEMSETGETGVGVRTNADGSPRRGFIAPVRSSSALILSSTNINRERIYIQQPPVSASGYSSQAFAPHYPHTERLVETKTCTDCHLSADGDNNAIMAQLLLHGTNFVNFVGKVAWVGGTDTLEGVSVTEWEEPQAVIGSYLHRYAYPDWFRRHEENGQELQEAHSQDTAGEVGCIQMRGEYLYVAEGTGGFEVYDIASISNKGISDRIISAPFSPLGHDAHVETRNATCMALATNQPVSYSRNQHIVATYPENEEQEMHPIYRYAFITDAEEGLIVVDIDTFQNGEPRDNFLERALTWNEGGVLTGARHITIAGTVFYIATDRGIVVLDMTSPLQPRVASEIVLPGARATAVQFRYLFALDGSGLKIFDITDMSRPLQVEGAEVALQDARRIYIARTYAYVASGAQGLAIIDVERPEAPRLHQLYTADGQLNDARDVIVGTTNASLFAYVADGVNGLKVLQLTSPELNEGFYGWSPEPRPTLIAWRRTHSPATALSKGLDRDRAVDETGHQMAIFGRRGSRPFTRAEMEEFFLHDGRPWFVRDAVDLNTFVPGADGVVPTEVISRVGNADPGAGWGRGPGRRQQSEAPPVGGRSGAPLE